MHRTAIGKSYGPHVVDFFRMTEAARARFVACTRRKGTPNPTLASYRNAPGTIRGWIVLSLLALAAMTGLGYIDFGELTPGRPSQPEPFFWGYAALGVVLCFGIFSAIRVAIVRGKLPYGPGVYVFPVDLVDARTNHLGLIPMSELKEAKVNEGERGRSEAVLTFRDGSSFTFPLGKTDVVVIEELEQMRAGVQKAVDTGDEAMLEQLDCFFAERVAEGWTALRPEGKSTPLRPKIPAFAAIVSILALAAGPLAGRGFWSLRNDTSDRAALRRAAAAHDYRAIDAYIDGGGRLADEADNARFEAAIDMGEAGLTRRTLEHYIHHGKLHVDAADDLYFEGIKAENSSLGWKTYLDNGKRHVAEADDGLFEWAKHTASVEAYDLYLAVGKRHADEVRAKWKPMAELEIAKRDRSPAAIRKFLAAHKDPELQRVAGAALHDRFEAVRSTYVAGFSKKTPAAELVEQLLQRMETGKPLAVRLRQFPSGDMASADDDLVKKHRGRGVRSLGYFGAARDITRQNAIAHEVLAAFGSVFGGDVIDVDSSEGAVDADQPVLDVGCEFSPDGHYEYDLSKGVFLSVAATCDAVLKVPGEHAAPPLRFRAKFVPNRLHFTGAMVADNVYEGMMDPLPELIASRLKRLVVRDGG